MHIFVTGGAGYIGSICSEELLNAGHQVTIFDNLTEGHRLAIDPRATFIEGDLAKRDEIMTAVAGAKPAAIMHFAANALVGESMTDADYNGDVDDSKGWDAIRTRILALRDTTKTVPELAEEEQPVLAQESELANVR